jgi:hypothetical protein
VDSFDLPLKVVGQSDHKWSLSIHKDSNSRLYGGNEPWYSVSVQQDGSTFDGAVATQPFSCFKAVADGRKTAMMCDQGMLALYLAGDEVIMDFHTVQGEKLSGSAPGSTYIKYLESLDSQY